MSLSTFFASSRYSYLDNGTIRIGVDLWAGGAIGYLSASGTGSNFLNTHDTGRYAAQSYNGGPIPFGNPTNPSYPNWQWNATEGGDSWGNPSPVVAVSNDGAMLYTKTIPLQWGLINTQTEGYCEKWITLSGNVAKVICKLTLSRSDQTLYAPQDQGCPALYSNGQYYKLWTYNGTAPWTSDTLTQLTTISSQTSYAANECWSALVNDAGAGFGIFAPGIVNWSDKSNGTLDSSSQWAPASNPSVFCAPQPHDHLDYNIVYTYTYYLIVGAVSDVRAYAVANQPDLRPNYSFGTDRQHWYIPSGSGTDAGWPGGNLGFWRVYTQGPAFCYGPLGAWQAAAVPTVYIKARYSSQAYTTARLRFSANAPLSSRTFTNFVDFAITADGAWRTYTVPLSGNGAYTGLITGLRLDPTNTVSGNPGDYVDIAYIGVNNPG